MFRAVRWMYLVVTLVGAITFLFPSFGWYDYFQRHLGGPDRIVGLAVGWALLGVFIEHLRGAVLRSRQAYLAQALIRISPNLKKIEAARILVRALESDDESVVSTAHAELQRLTNVDHGTDPAAWRQWIAQQQKQEGQQQSGPD